MKEILEQTTVEHCNPEGTSKVMWIITLLLDTDTLEYVAEASAVFIDQGGLYNTINLKSTFNSSEYTNASSRCRQFQHIAGCYYDYVLGSSSYWSYSAVKKELDSRRASAEWYDYQDMAMELVSSALPTLHAEPLVIIEPTPTEEERRLHRTAEDMNIGYALDRAWKAWEQNPPPMTRLQVPENLNSRLREITVTDDTCHDDD